MVFVFFNVFKERYLFNKNSIKSENEELVKIQTIELEVKKVKSAFWMVMFAFVAPLFMFSISASLHNIWFGISFFLLAFFSMIRFFRKRYKATDTAYQYIIFSERLNSKKDNIPQEKVLALVSMDRPSDQHDVISLINK